MEKSHFEWNENKESSNKKKHNVSFYVAQKAFLDPNRVIAKDLAHSNTEQKYYCFGKVDGEIMTVRFTHRGNKIQIIGEGYWRRGRKIYEQEKSKIHR